MKQATTMLTWMLALLVTGCGGSTSSPPATRVPINTATGWSDSPFISRDGQRLYFMYSRYDFGPWILSGGTVEPQATGPDRPGLHKSMVNAFDESDIYVSTKNPDGSWSEPVNLGLNGAYGDSSGMEIDNGNTFVWLQGNGVTANDLVMASKTAGGGWSAPVAFGGGINDHSAGTFQDNPHISPDGNGLWFTSNRANGYGGRDLWFSLKSGGVWSTPVNLGADFNAHGDEDQMWVSPVTPDLYWKTDRGLMNCTWNANTGSCSAAAVVVTIPGCSYTAEVSMPDSGTVMYFGCGDFRTGRVRIMYSVKQPNGQWGTATPVD